MTEAEDYGAGEEEERPPDRIQAAAREEIIGFFEENRDAVFSSRQVEVHFEARYFHWITHRVLNDLKDSGQLGGEATSLEGGVPLNVFWHTSNRYTRRKLGALVEVIQRYSDPAFTAALGNTGELLG